LPKPRNEKGPGGIGGAPVCCRIGYDQRTRNTLAIAAHSRKANVIGVVVALIMHDF
jgi:hypothetical protein